jgi:hypothetical protein
MESSQPVQPARRSQNPEEQRREDKEASDAANKEAVEKLSAPEQPTPTQAEADAFKEGDEVVEGVVRQRRDVKPGAQASGYTTR